MKGLFSCDRGSLSVWFSCVKYSWVVSEWLSLVDKESNCSGDWFWDLILVMGRVWKLDETWPSDYDVIV